MYTELTRHVVDTNGHAPIKQLPQRTPFALKKKMEKMIDEMLESGVVKYLHSPWASPVVSLTKKDGTLRFVWTTTASQKWILSCFLESMTHWIYRQTHPVSQLWTLCEDIGK